MGLPKVLFIFILIIVFASASATAFLMLRFPKLSNYRDFFMQGDETFAYTEGSHWTLGFAKRVTTPENLDDKTYYIAGYNSNNPATEVLDDTYARAIWIDDNTGRGGVGLIAIDCVGMSRKDIMDIKERLSDFIVETNTKHLNVILTHTHAAIDTQGMWGPKFYKTGRDNEYMEFLKDRAAEAMTEAYANRVNGELYTGAVQTQNMLDDVRTPITYDDNLYRLRFVPEGEGRETFIINYACHAELLGKFHSKISADFPAYMGEYIDEHQGADFMFIPGAIGGMISAYDIKNLYDDPNYDTETYTKEYGKSLGEYVLTNLNEDTLLAPILNVKSKRIVIPVDNILLTIARFLGVLNNDVVRVKGRIAKYSLPTEISYMELGNSNVSMFLVPGELYPELQMGGFLPKEESATGKDADYKVLNDLLESQNIRFVVGLSNDAIGYIIPDNDYLLHDKLPYVNWATDKFDRQHYEETNSTGKNTARIILEAFEELINSI